MIISRRLSRLLLTNTLLFAGTSLFAQSTFNPSGVTKLASYGSAGQGEDDTLVFQTALNSAARAGETLEVEASAQPYNVRPLTIPSNTNLLLDAGAVVQAVPGYQDGQVLLSLYDVRNVAITGTAGRSIFRMRGSEYTSGESRNCLDIRGSDGVTISGIECNDSGGDGIYIGEGGTPYSSNVEVSQSSFDSNRRQGMTVTSGQNISVSDCQFTNSAGTDPNTGIDIEPNRPTDILQNIFVQNSTVSGNAGNGIAVGIRNLTDASQPVSITFSGMISENNRGSGYAVSAQRPGGVRGPTGSIVFERSTSTNDAVYGAVASYYDVADPLVTFQDLSITNANSSRRTSDGAAFAVRRGGGDANPMGNVVFTGMAVTDTAGYLSYYFSVEDYSGTGISHVAVNALGLLTGIRGSGADGLVNGVPASLVNIR